MKKIIIILSILIFVITSLIVYEAMNINKIDDFKIISINEQSCNLQNDECELNVADLGKVNFKITPTPILMNEQISLIVTPEFGGLTEVWVDFLGLEMEMGYNRTKLKRIGDRYIAKGFLPTCTEKQMTWKATLLIKIKTDTYGYEFKFKTSRNDEK